jgi:hypothetical protein
MNKEKFMQLAEKAFDEGALINFYFSHLKEKEGFVPVSEQEAHSIALLAKEAFGGALTLVEDKESPCTSYVVRNEETLDYVSCSFKREVKSNAV